MRLVVDITAHPDGPVEGSVLAEGDDPAAFHGWLEMIRLIQASISADGASVSASPSGSLPPA